MKTMATICGENIVKNCIDRIFGYLKVKTIILAVPAVNGIVEIIGIIAILKIMVADIIRFRASSRKMQNEIK
jgi:hypothetical protein